jgi:succinate dehydrogenase / fumarate reductase cytochrome b subunit
MDLQRAPLLLLTIPPLLGRLAAYNLIRLLARRNSGLVARAIFGPGKIEALAGSSGARGFACGTWISSGHRSNERAGETTAVIEAPMVQPQVSEKPVDQKKVQAVRKPRGFWSANPIVVLWGTMVGKKVVMAVTGVILVGFVIAHMLGNIKVFIGMETFNTYAAFLRTMGEPLLPYSALLWVARSILLLSAILHIVAAVELTLMNRAARLHGYEAKKSKAATIASLSMRWSGVLLAVFIVFHLLHLTVGWVGYKPDQFLHDDVYNNVVAGFSVWYVSAFYIVSMAALCLHLDHGVWSMLQTMGLNDARSSSVLRMMSRGVAILVFAGFISVPVAVLAGWVH